LGTGHRVCAGKPNRSDRDGLVTNKPIRKLFKLRISEINSSITSLETIQKFVLHPRDYSIEKRKVTPTVTLSCKIIYEQYKYESAGMSTDNNN
jgi:long-subunit acyl-CoA synthetase (AMP-forming)